VQATPAASDCAFGCEISEDREHCAIVIAGRAADTAGYVVDLAWYDHPRGAVDQLAELSGQWYPVDVVIDEKSQSSTLVKPLAAAGIAVKTVNILDVATAHAEFLDLVKDGLLLHRSQEPLTAAVRAAQQKPLSGAQAWQRRVLIDQAPLVASTLAVWAFRRWEEASVADVWVL
jgi:hypothetical protein